MSSFCTILVLGLICTTCGKSLQVHMLIWASLSESCRCAAKRWWNLFTNIDLVLIVIRAYMYRILSASRLLLGCDRCCALYTGSTVFSFLASISLSLSLSLSLCFKGFVFQFIKAQDHNVISVTDDVYSDTNSQKLANFFYEFCRLLIFKIRFFEQYFRNTIRVSNTLDPDQARHFVGPYLGPNCLQMLSADNTGKHKIFY